MSRSFRGRVRSLLHFVLWGLLAAPQSASAEADRVVLFPVAGTATPERAAEIERALDASLAALGHVVVAPTTSRRPQTSAQMRETAELANADYVVMAEVAPLPAQYRLHVFVYDRRQSRLEDLIATVLTREEDARLSDILASMVRPEGLGGDALRLTDERRAEEGGPEAEASPEPPPTPTDSGDAAPPDAAPLDAAPPDAAPPDAAPLHAEADRPAAADPPAVSTPYGGSRPWLVQGSVGGAYAAVLEGRSGGGLLVLGPRVGYLIDLLPGLELRAGLDILTGVATAVGAHAGAAFFAPLSADPLYLGAELEVGVYGFTTGGRDASFSARAAALFAVAPLPPLYLEVGPQVGLLSAGSGVLTVGVVGRGGYRF